MENIWYFQDEQYSSTTATPASPSEEDAHYDLISLLALVQASGTDILPISWHPELQLLGRGGSAQVNQSRIDLQTDFAFKRVRGGKDDAANMRAIMLEIAILEAPAIRAHPNISKLFGICWEVDRHTKKPSPVLVAEKAPFGDLKSFLKSDRVKRLSKKEKIGLCMDIASAVKTLHASNIVHGDLKPENILVFPGENDDVVAMVTDFGYSCFGHDLVKLPFSRDWAAPEWHDRPFTVSAAKKSDYFSFGMVSLSILYNDLLAKETTEVEVMDGHSFSGVLRLKDKLEAAARELILRDLELSDFDKADLASFMSACLHLDVTLRQMDVTFLDRFGWWQRTETNNPTVTKVSFLELKPHTFQLANSLLELAYSDFRVRQEVVENLKEITMGQSCLSCLSKCCPSAALQLAVCHAIGFGAPRNNQEVSNCLQLCGKEWEDAKAEIELLNLKTRTHAFRSSQFQELWDAGHVRTLEFGLLYHSRGDIDLAKQDYRQGIQDLENVLGDAHLAVLALKSTLSSILREETSWKEAEENEQEVLVARKKMYGQKHPETLSSLKAMTTIYRGLGRVLDAENTARELLPLMDEVYGTENAMTLAVVSNLASTLLDTRQYKQAEELYLRVFEVEKRLAGLEHPDTMITMGNLAICLKSQEKYGEAEKYALWAKETAEKTLGMMHPLTVRIISNLASIYCDCKQFIQGRDILLPLVEASESAVVSQNPQTLHSLNVLASIYTGLKQYAEAERITRNVLEMQKRTLFDRHPMTLKTMSGLALILSEQERHMEAHNLFLEVIDLSRSVLGDTHPDTLDRMLNLAVTCQHLGKWDLAEKLQSHVIKSLMNDHGNEDDATTLIALSQLSETYKGQGRLFEAKELAERVLEIRMRVLGRNHESTVVSMTRVASILDRLGQEVEADVVRSRAIEVMRENGTLSQLYE